MVAGVHQNKQQDLEDLAVAVAAMFTHIQAELVIRDKVMRVAQEFGRDLVRPAVAVAVVLLERDNKVMETLAELVAQELHY